MKSTVSNKPCNKEKPFPKLMIDEGDSMIIFFINKEEGIVVHKGTSEYPIGEYDHDWDMTYFTDFNGSVCLENGD